MPYAEDIAANWLDTNGGPTTDVQGTFSVTGGLASSSPPEFISVTITPATLVPVRRSR